MRTFLLLLTIFCFCISLIAQTNISGVINSYAAISDIDYCMNTLEVDQTAGFNEGMDVLLIQMQGASINASNSPVYGDVTDLGGAGQFERATIASIAGTTVTLQNALVNTYNLSGQVQLVSLPNYENATINDTLRADPWNGQKGGVLILEVENTLSMQSEIDVSGLGFRGGQADIAASNNCNFLTNANNYAYELNNWRGALKGEGIALPVSDQETGRGALANAGGGGNDHNTGGGGGANLRNGGQGGENREPSNFGCDGDFPGIGGKGLPEMDNLLFLGGGGGAGHENNNEGTGGGNGGGIVILIAQTLEANDFKILANGQTATTSLGDGAGGGGGGGSIWLDISGILGGINIEAKGGNGGISNNNNFDRCIGAGGGGSGGVLYINPVFDQNFDFSAGVAGMSINSNLSECPDGTYGATNGTEGIKLDIGNIPMGSETNSAPQIVEISNNVSACLGDEVNLIAVVEGFDLTYQWQINMGSGFEDLMDNEQFSGTQTSLLTISNISELFADYSFRLVIGNDCFEGIMSDPISITLTLLPTADFNFIVDGLSVNFENLSENGEAYNWSFGDTNTSDDINPSHQYAESGTYEVVLTVSNECGEESFTQMVSLAEIPIANFSVNPMIGCAPLTVQYVNQSSADATSLAWVFPGGNPGFSSSEIQLVTYTEPGIYSATLIASNAVGVDTLTFENAVEVIGMPVADFEASIDGLTATFTNLSIGGDTFLWNFGDANSSIEENPEHTFSEPGIYQVFLQASNGCGQNVIIIPISIGSTPLPDFSIDVVSGCAPALVNFNNQSTGDYDNLQWAFPGGDPVTSTEDNPTVTYSEPGTYDVSLSLFGPLGDPVLFEENIIEVLPFPEPDFTFEIDGLSVSFTNTSQFANSYTWNFGDGTTSNETDPIHTFSSAGVYEVTLNALNNFCGSSLNQTISVMITSVEDAALKNDISIFPNPFGETINLQFRSTPIPLVVELKNMKGQNLKVLSIQSDTQLDLGVLPAGMYYFVFKTAKGTWVEKIIKS